MNRSIVATGLVLACGLCTVILVSTRLVSQGQDAARETATSVAPPECQFTIGQQAAFDYQTTATALGQSDRFAATLNLEVVNTSADGARIRAAFRNIQLTQQLTPESEQAVAPENWPFFLDVDRRCRIQNRAYSAQWAAASRKLIDTQLDNLAFALPTTAQPRWQANTDDGLGRYTAVYRRTETAPFTIHREKQHHQLRSGADTFGIDIQLLSSQADAVFSASSPIGWQSVTGQEAVRIRIPQQPELTLSQTFSLTRDDQRFTAVPMLDSAVADRRASADDVATSHPLPDNRYTSYGETRQAFQDAIGEKPPRHYDAALALAAWLKAHPDDVAQLVDELRTDMPAAQRPAAFLALQLSATSAAHTALSDLLFDAALSDVDQARAASALADWGAPRQDTVDRLLARGEIQDTAGTVSLLAIGSMLPRTNDASLRDQMVQSLQQRYADAGSVPATLVMLDAMGNSRDPAFLDTLEDGLNRSDSAVRRHAAQALTKLPATDASSRLMNRLGDEQDNTVQVTLVKALTQTGTDVTEILPTLDQQLASGNSNQRTAIIELLGHQNTAAARQLLVQQFKRETNAHLQQQIGRYVSAESLR